MNVERANQSAQAACVMITRPGLKDVHYDLQAAASNIYLAWNNDVIDDMEAIAALSMVRDAATCLHTK